MAISRKEYFHYVPVSERDVQWGLYVTGAGCGDWRANDPYPRERHPDVYHFTWDQGRVLPEYQVVLIVRGGGVFESGPTGRRRIVSPAVLITMPGVWHRYRPDTETGWTEYWVGMNGEQLHRLQRQGILRPENPILPIAEGSELVGLFEDLIDRVRVDPQRTHSIATVALQILASALELAEARPLPQRTTPMQSAEDAIIAEAVQFIWDHSQRPMTIDELVDQLPVSRRSLERRFRKALGRSILDEITRCRLQRARQLLEETSLPVAQVAAAAGFSSTDRMNEVFQRDEGVSPWAYRKKAE